MLVPLSPEKSSGRTGEAVGDMLSWGSGLDEEMKSLSLDCWEVIHYLFILWHIRGNPTGQRVVCKALPGFFTPAHSMERPRWEGEGQASLATPELQKGGGSWTSTRQRQQKTVTVLGVNVWAGLESEPCRLLTEMQGKLYKISWPVKWGRVGFLLRSVLGLG